jgi:Xaa-Pro aminopeptidase
VIRPEGPVLFLTAPDPHTLVWQGPVLEMEEAFGISGIEDIRWESEQESFMADLLHREGALYLNHSPDKALNGRPNEASRMWLNVEANHPTLSLESLVPLLTSLRMIKEMEEIGEIRKAAKITREAFLEVLPLIRPGIREYEIEAVITSHFLRSGAGGHAFEPIVASGYNALVLHYVDNSGTCRDGELLLMDFGAELQLDGADGSRTVTVNSRFTPRQRELYDATLRVFKKARALMAPGITLGDLHKKTGSLWEEEHLSLGLYSRQDVKDRSEEDPLWKKYFMHGTSHSLGLDTHDPFDRAVPLEEGMVLTCEPGIYLPEEGTGIRLENDILITADGPVDLMDDIPLEVGEIEERMQNSPG